MNELFNYEGPADGIKSARECLEYFEHCQRSGNFWVVIEIPQVPGAMKVCGRRLTGTCETLLHTKSKYSGFQKTRDRVLNGTVVCGGTNWVDGVLFMTVK